MLNHLPRPKPFVFVRRGAVGLISMLLCCAAAADDRIDDVMYQDPAFPPATTYAEFSDKLKPLWLEALNRPESELQRLAADTIALAHRSGMSGLGDTANKLIAIVQTQKLEPTVRNAAARALVTLDANQAAEAFGKAMDSCSLEMATIIEPALAHWDYVPVREIWRQRLDDPATQRARLLLAIECLGAVKDLDAFAAVLAIVTDANAQLPTRIAAARAAANINDNAVLETAIKLTAADGDQPMASLLATTLLTSQTSSEAVSFLKRMAANDSTVVSGLALRRLFEIDPTHVYEFAEKSISSNDVNVRRVGCEALVHQADTAAVSLLSPVLDDPNPGLRYFVSQSLIQLAERKSLRDAVIDASIRVAAMDAWRGPEQAIIILGTLDYESAAPQLFELLDHRRPEVAIAAGWSLRKLAIVDTLPDMLAQAEQRTKLYRDEGAGANRIIIEGQLSQLFQAFGEMGYPDAEMLMRTFIPKNSISPDEARAAAVWAIGKLKEGKLDQPLANILAKRLSDVNPANPELETVRRMSAIAIGRMKAESQLSALREFVGEAPRFPGQACAWSLERITGEIHEFSLQRAVQSEDWFLAPR